MTGGDDATFYDRYWRTGLGWWSPRGKNPTSHEQRLIERYIAPKARVLDFGCGDGAHLGQYCRATNRPYTGVDVSEEAISLCRAAGLTAFRYGPGERLPFEDGSFDAVVSFEVLEHVARPDMCIAEIRRVLAPGGVFLGSVPNVAFVSNRVFLGLGFFNPGGSPV